MNPALLRRRALILSAGGGPAPAPIPRPNLVLNGDFERGSVGAQAPNWTLALGNGLLIATDQTHDGVQSGKIDNSVTAVESKHTQVIPVVVGGIYELQAWVRWSGGTISRTGVGFPTGSYTLLESEGSVTVNAGIQYIAVNAQSTWVWGRMKIQITSGTSITLQCHAGIATAPSGTAWYDGITFTRMDIPAPTNLLVNGAFENGAVGAAIPGWTLALGTQILTANDQFILGKSAKIDHGGTAQETRWIQAVPVVANNVYELSGYVRSTATPGRMGFGLPNDGAFTTIEEEPALTFNGGHLYVNAPATPNTWKNGRWRFRINATFTSINVSIFMGLSSTLAGQTWFDELTLIQVAN